jgi:quercetin dioxygenase-like cupin family protein
MGCDCAEGVPGAGTRVAAIDDSRPEVADDVSAPDQRGETMALEHAKPGEVIDLRAFGARLRSEQTRALIKTESLELMRVVLPAGEGLPRHSVYGEVTLQCIEGRVRVQAQAGEHELRSGELVLLPAGDEHAVHALDDSSLLVTVQLPPGRPGSASSTS